MKKPKRICWMMECDNPRNANKIYCEMHKREEPVKVKKCRRDFGYLDSKNLRCILDYEHKGKHEAKITWS